MECGSDPTLHATLEPQRPLGAARSVDADLGPISPELALVDQVLAERARTLLPEPRERPRPATRLAPRPSTEVRSGRAPKARPAPVRRRKRRWPATALLAVIIFAAGAFSGGFLGENHSASQRVTLEVKAGGPAATGESRGGARPATDQASIGRTHVTTWAANVLGVTASVDGTGVKLAWQRPPDSDHIVVLRAGGAQRDGVVVFRDSETSYRDSTARTCTEYRYTIVNYDRHGHRSTGVPTSVVTQGCA